MEHSKVTESWKCLQENEKENGFIITCMIPMSKNYYFYENSQSAF